MRLTEKKKQILKDLMKKLHAGMSPKEAKEKFRQVLEDITPLEISKIEQELIEDGMQRDEIQKLCDIHLAVFREQLEKQKLDIPEWHPITILMEEHKIMLQLAKKLETITRKTHEIGDISNVGDEIRDLEHIAEDFRDSEKHYLREENVLFPFLEKHGIKEPPRIMWMEHNEIRERKKALHKLVKERDALNFEEFKRQLDGTSKSLNTMLPNHYFKENSILFPTALKVMTTDEWRRTRLEFDEIGYCCFTPKKLAAPHMEEAEKQKIEEPIVPEGILQFETGSLSKEEVEAILDSLPVDISFVDAEDRVKYFNKAEERIFVRTKAVIGRKVQLCHPQKSVHVVEKIVEAFKTGKKDVAEFWININNRLIHIRYFAVRDRNGKYLGTMEVTQDLTEIKKIEGEKRLLDWKM